ncbi:streptavidin v2 precursor [Lentinula novae-zelandiae]|nr:streptavidin v2 precursor [Lentinula novae-zelandiae]
MTRFFVAVLLLGLASCISCISGAPSPTALTLPQSQIGSQLSGNWINELGSTMTLIADQNGGLSGQYNSAVGNATDLYNLTGRFDILPPSDAGISVGWVVTYNNELRNAHSTATWSGQCFNNSGGETILTQWLLTTSSAQADVWESTLVGHDKFTRAEISA